MRNRSGYPFLIPVILAAILIAGFGNVAGNYFQCDDFLHTAYQYRVFHGEPLLLVKNFVDTWLSDRSFFNFYRPLTELSIALDYLFYGACATGYHLTNLLLHLVNALLVFPIALTLIEQFAPGKRRDNLLVAFLSSAIWLSFPTHSEAVAWILSRSDLVATAFYLAAYLSFLKKRRMLTAFFFILSLLSKESAVTLPFLMAATAYLQNETNDESNDETIKKLKARLSGLSSYFLILLCYLVIRALSIGTLLGGYVGSVGDTLSAHIIERWFTSGSLFYLFHPFNEQLIPADSTLRLSIRIIYCLFAVLVAINQFIDQSVPRKTRLVILLCLWGLLTMAPNLQVFSISSLMAGGRISYLPSVSLSLLIALSVYCFSPRQTSGHWKIAKVFGVISLVAFIFVNCLTVRTNNLAWCGSSAAIIKIKAALEEELEKLPQGKKLVVLNLPDQIAGAYTFTTRFDFLDMLRPPLSAKGTDSRVVPLDFHNFWSANINLDDLRYVAAHPEKYKLEAFNNLTMKLEPLAVPVQAGSTAPFPIDQPSKTKPRESRITLLETSEICKTDGEATKTKIYYYSIDPPINPFDYQYLELSYPGKLLKEDELTFFNWNNKPNLNGPDLPLSFAFEKGNTTNRFFFDVGENKNWLLSKNISNFQVLLPLGSGRDTTPPTLRLLKEELVAPSLGFVQDKYEDLVSMHELERGRKLEQNSSRQSAQISLAYDATKLPGAASVTLEIGKPYIYFEHYTYLLRDDKDCKKLLSTQEFKPLRGKIKISHGEFPEAATYQVRLKAKDACGRIIGNYSRPLTLIAR